MAEPDIQTGPIVQRVGTRKSLLVLLQLDARLRLGESFATRPD